MPRTPGSSRGSSFRSAGASPSSPVGSVNDYGSGQTAIRRHEYTSAILGTGAIATGFYQIVPLLKFKRTFSGVTDDVPPTPTSGFNFQTPEVFNGSKVENFQAVVHISNLNRVASGYLTVYESALSFWDAFIWDNIYLTQCPVTFDNVGVAPDTRGEIAYKTPTATLITSNLNKSNKFLQRYIRQVGQIFIPTADAFSGSVDLKVSKLPPKVRRSQTGMNYTLYLHNDSVVNNSAAVQADTSLENSFDEVPSDVRMPYIS